MMAVFGSERGSEMTSLYTKPIPNLYNGPFVSMVMFAFTITTLSPHLSVHTCVSCIYVQWNPLITIKATGTFSMIPLN